MSPGRRHRSRFSRDEAQIVYCLENNRELNQSPCSFITLHTVEERLFNSWVYVRVDNLSFFFLSCRSHVVSIF